MGDKEGKKKDDHVQIEMPDEETGGGETSTLTLTKKSVTIEEGPKPPVSRLSIDSVMSEQADEEMEQFNLTTKISRNSMSPEASFYNPSLAGFQDPTGVPEDKCCTTYPCCFGLPVEIGLEFLCIFDMLFSFVCLITWACIFGMDIFAPKQRISNHTDIFIPPYLRTTQLTTTTTLHPFWTLRTTTTEPPLYDYNDDIDNLSREYSKISRNTDTDHEFILQHCGIDYFTEFLFTNELTKTRDLWEHCLWLLIGTEMLSIFLAIAVIMCICCFMEHRGTKILMMVLWMFEWSPVFLLYYAMILSQSQRLCIIEYGYAKRPAGIRGQMAFLIFLTARIVFLKTYQMLVHYVYIKEFLAFGYLRDEAVHPGTESEYSRSYFREFYALEAQREGQYVDAYMAQDTAHMTDYDNLIPYQIAGIQNTIMTGQNDELADLNEEIREVQSTSRHIETSQQKGTGKAM